MENVFRTRSETANRVYKYCRTGPDKFPIWFGFDVSGQQITSKGIACSESFHLLEILIEIFVFEIFELSDGFTWVVSTGRFCANIGKKNKKTLN